MNIIYILGPFYIHEYIEKLYMHTFCRILVKTYINTCINAQPNIHTYTLNSIQTYTHRYTDGHQLN